MFSLTPKPLLSSLDPLTAKALDIVRQTLLLEARAHVAAERKEIDDHNHIDLYFGGLHPWPHLSPRGLRLRFLRRALKELPMKTRVAEVRRSLAQNERVELDLTIMKNKAAAHRARKAARAEELRRQKALKKIRRRPIERTSSPTGREA
jgi:hypothetical protein